MGQMTSKEREMTRRSCGTSPGLSVREDALPKQCGRALRRGSIRYLPLEGIRYFASCIPGEQKNVYCSMP